MLDVDDQGRVRVLTLNRPEALNAFNEALYDATTEALMAAASDPDVAVVVITGTGRAFSAGTDVMELAARTMDPGGFTPGIHGFAGMIDQLAAFPKPLLLAINGMGLGIGATIVGFADLVVMSTAARLRCPFTDLAVAPEAASSVLFPMLLGRQHATWMLMSSEWFSATECERMGVAWKVAEPDDLMAVTMAAARHLAAKPIASLVESKRTIVAGTRELIAAARHREHVAFARLLGTPANTEALAAFGQRRPPDFTSVDAQHPVDIARHAAD